MACVLKSKTFQAILIRSGRSLLPSSGGHLPSSGIISIKAAELRLLTFRPFYHVFPAFQWFACDFGWSNDPSFCSWTSEDTGSRWQIQSSGTPTLNTGPNMDHTGTGHLTQHTHYTFPLFSSQQHALFYPTGGSGNFIYTLATGPQETKVARLVSPMVTSLDSDLCVSFWYHMFGSHIGTLHIKQRKQTVDGPADILLWTVSGHQGSRWREGRVLVPETNKPYQVSRNHSFFDFRSAPNSEVRERVHPLCFFLRW